MLFLDDSKINLARFELSISHVMMMEIGPERSGLFQSFGEHIFKE